jgi:undecaprenyl-diphosphatase
MPGKRRQPLTIWIVRQLRFISRRIMRFGRHEPLVLLVMLLVALSIWTFAEVADEVLENETHAFDQAVLLALRTPGDPSNPRGPGWLEELALDVTALGSAWLLTFLTLAVAGFLLLKRQRRMATLVVIAVGGAILLSTTLKRHFDRPRPGLVPHSVIVHTASFPSGHATKSAAVYLTLGALLARVQPQRRLKLYVLALAVMVTMMVGISRVYLGVHWPTDVLAGWAIGAAWALFCWLMAFWLQQRGQIAQAGQEDDLEP